MIHRCVWNKLQYNITLQPWSWIRYSNCLARCLIVWLCCFFTGGRYIDNRSLPLNYLPLTRLVPVELRTTRFAFPAFTNSNYCVHFRWICFTGILRSCGLVYLINYTTPEFCGEFHVDMFIISVLKVALCQKIQLKVNDIVLCIIKKL